MSRKVYVTDNIESEDLKDYTGLVIDVGKDKTIHSLWSNYKITNTGEAKIRSSIASIGRIQIELSNNTFSLHPTKNAIYYMYNGEIVDNNLNLAL